MKFLHRRLPLVYSCVCAAAMLAALVFAGLGLIAKNNGSKPSSVVPNSILSAAAKSAPNLKMPGQAQAAVAVKARPRAVLAQPEAPSHARLMATYGKLPLSFEANQGQTDSQVKFLARGRGYALFLTANEAVLSLRKPPAQGQSKLETGNAAVPFGPNPEPRVPPPASPAPAVVSMKLVGANAAAEAKGLEELPGRSNYFLGNDPQKWRTNVPNYAKVKYQGVYPGVDLVYYGNQQQLEYDFVVAPGGDPKAIALEIETRNPKLAPTVL